MNVEILLFATFSDIAGARKVALEVAEPCSVASVIQALQEKFPALREYDLRKILVAVNQEMSGPERVISEGDEVGVFPPVSGGRSQIENRRSQIENRKSMNRRRE